MAIVFRNEGDFRVYAGNVTNPAIPASMNETLVRVSNIPRNERSAHKYEIWLVGAEREAAHGEAVDPKRLLQYGFLVRVLSQIISRLYKYSPDQDRAFSVGTGDMGARSGLSWKL